MTNRSVGIKDVAAAAGVSVTTVSHVLNDVAYARVGAGTRERVHEAAQRLGYGPNRLAQALRTQRSGMIGFISEEIATTPHAGRIILGAEETARARGYSIMIINSTSTSSQDSRESDVADLSPRQVEREPACAMPERVGDLVVGGVGLAHEQVLAHRCREQRRLFEREADVAAQAVDR